MAPCYHADDRAKHGTRWGFPWPLLVPLSGPLFWRLGWRHNGELACRKSKFWRRSRWASFCEPHCQISRSMLKRDRPLTVPAVFMVGHWCSELPLNYCLYSVRARTRTEQDGAARDSTSGTGNKQRAGDCIYQDQILFLPPINRGSPVFLIKGAVLAFVSTCRVAIKGDSVRRQISPRSCAFDTWTTNDPGLVAGRKA